MNGTDGIKVGYPKCSWDNGMGKMVELYLDLQFKGQMG